MGKEKRKKMTIKIALLKSGETIISEAKELVYKESEDSENQVYGYLFTKPKKINLNSPIFLAEDSDQESSVQVSLTSWFLITNDESFSIPKDWIVTFMNPVDKIVEMYQESLND